MRVRVVEHKPHVLVEIKDTEYWVTSLVVIRYVEAEAFGRTIRIPLGHRENDSPRAGEPIPLEAE